MDVKQKKVLITGGTGFLGAYIIRALLKAGYTKIIATRRKNSSLDLLESIRDQVQFIETDINDISGLDGAISQADIVIHAAALVSFVPADRDALFKINMEGTANVVNICLTRNIEKLIYISSIAAIGRDKSRIEIDENSKWVESERNTHYAISKYLGEQEVWRGQIEGLSTAIINPSLILGAGFWDSGSSSLIKHIYNGLSYYPAGKTGVVDVRDVAAMTLQLIEKDIEEERFICNGANISYKALFEKLAIQFDLKPADKKLNKFLMALAWRAAWIKSLFSGIKATVSRESLMVSSSEYEYSSNKSIDVLDFTYRPLEETIKDSCEAFLKSKSANAAFSIME